MFLFLCPCGHDYLVNWIFYPKNDFLLFRACVRMGKRDTLPAHAQRPW
jgi:hypothetical protein